MENKVKIENLISSRVILSMPELRLKRVWEKKGAIKTIPFEQLEEAIYDPGVESLFVDGVLGIADMDVKKKLGLEPEEAEEPVNIIVLSDKERKEWLVDLSVAEFRNKIKELPREQVIELANYAVDNEITNFEKSEILKRAVGIDVLSRVKLNRDNKAEVEEK
jgi:hypothetical protein